MPKHSEHTFHIPVLGIGYSADTPVKVARYGISSVISLTDPSLLEKLRKYYCEQENETYTEIKGHDAASLQVTAYLNMVNRIVKKQIDTLKNSAFEKGSEIVKYFEMLPDTSILKKAYLKVQEMKASEAKDKEQQWLREQIVSGSIDVNIMTKLDSAHFDAEGNALPLEYNDAHAALRGFAQSDLTSAIVFSAGMNPRLYSYLETFADFYPNAEGVIKKRIILKVSDYRSAIVQGKVLAKKGLWVSEFRIESGLNCGGHAFATDGYLMGPILEEFKNNREALQVELAAAYAAGLKAKNIELKSTPELHITVQGGVGTVEEHNFLRRYYRVNSVGWGSPFMLVPEAINMDDDTIEMLCNAGEEDFFMSNASPLGVKFNNVRKSSMCIDKKKRAQEGKAGYPCLKGYLKFNTSFTERPICTASKQYMAERIKEIEASNLSTEDKRLALEAMTDKECLCVGLSTTTLRDKGIPVETETVSICPGPNLAYFSRKASLREMIDHIYGRMNLITVSNRPNLFIKELSLYFDHLKELVDENNRAFTEKNQQYIDKFRAKMLEGIDYYKNLVPELKEESEKVREKFQTALVQFEMKLKGLQVVVA
jgi:hypothetical protein